MTATFYPFSPRHGCVPICIALFLAWIASPTHVTGQVADTARAAAAEAANARAADLFRALAEAKSDGAREQAISGLHAMVRSKAPDEHEAIGRYGMSAFMTSADAKKQAEFTEHRAILAKVIPLMFGTLTGDVQDKAWWVLINVQDACPAPKRALWEQWWRDKGKAMFAPVSVPGSAVTPAPARPSPPPSTPAPTLRPPRERAKK
jgi:hypothetical protein